MKLSKNNNYLRVTDYKPVLTYIIYFLIIPFGFTNQITYWLSLGLGPVLLIKKGIQFGDFNVYSKKLLYSYGLTGLIVLLTGILSNNIYRPVQIFFIMISITISFAILFYRLKCINQLICLYLGLISTSIILSLFLLLTMYNGGFFFVFPESGILAKFGKNLVAPIIFCGFVSLYILQLIKFKLRGHLFWQYFIFVIIIMTGAIKMIMISSLVLVGFMIFINRITIKKLLIWVSGIMIGVFFLDKIPIGIKLLESKNYQLVSSRILILLGLDEYASLGHLNVTNKREGLIVDTWEIFLDNPIFGIGLENTRDILGTYSHNTFIELLAGGGVLLIFTFSLFTLYIFKAILKIKVNNIRNMMLIIFLCIIAMGLAQRIYDNRVVLVLLSTFVFLYKPISIVYKTHYEK